MKTNILLTSLVLIVMQSGCKVKDKADLLLVNGQVYCVDSAFSVKQAFAVVDGMFAATGSNEEILSRFESDLILDAGEKAVYPGFIDGHCHFFGYAVDNCYGANLKGTKSFSEILGILKEYHSQHPDSWIVGRGWDQNDWENEEFPDNTELDKLFPDVPVALIRIDGHAVLASNTALKIANINALTKIEGGKVIVRNGKPTGILLDYAADMMWASVPKPDQAAKKAALVEAQKDCFRDGLTTVNDAGLCYYDVMLIDSLQQSGKLKMRVVAMLSPGGLNFTRLMENGPFRTDKLTVNSVKLYADGALGSRGALLLEPYSDDPGNYGLRLSDPEMLKEIMAKACEKGFQVNTHCIGDSANRMMLHLYGEFLKGPNDRRWRIEHAQVINQNDFQLFKKYNIIPSIQSTHCTSDMYWAGERLGPERIKGAYASKTLLEQNGWLINGTDFPVEEISPLLTFYAAVGRMDLNGYPAGGFQIENGLSREEALRSMTIWAASGAFEENFKGSIEPGKVADFVILDRDIMSVPVKEIPGTNVLKTYIDGELVFE
jgi:predicted amidohydrolase YtcJ